MVQAGAAGLDTPRTNIGDATYLSNQQFDFDISQEQSFQSPSKDNNNLVQQLQNGRRGAIKTPRSRVALSDRRNLPAGLGGGEFTPLLKSATRNSALRNGKENSRQTPLSSGLGNIPEDITPLPVMNSSVYGDSRNGSYMQGTPLPQMDSSSTASTPMALLPRRNEGPGVLQDGNQLSLREQENVIDKIEKENFGLKLKIHFLEEALRKAGPGFSEAALKENTDLKVDKVTMQRELQRYRKTLAGAEKDVEIYRQELLKTQEKVKQKHADEGAREELDHLRQLLDESEAEVNRLKLQESRTEDLEDKIHDLETELRQKNRMVEDREDEADNLKDEVEKHLETISELKESLKQAQRRHVELEEKAQAGEDLEDAKEAINELEQELRRTSNELEEAKEDRQEAVEKLEQDLKRMKDELEEAKEDRQEALKEKERAESDLEELQGEMANKSITTKGLSRQIEEKVNRLQDELEDLREKHQVLEEDYENKSREAEQFQDRIALIKQDSDAREQKFKEKLEIVQKEQRSASQQRDALAQQLEAAEKELHQKSDEKNILQIRHDALTQESAGLQKELTRSRKEIEDLEDKLDHEKTLALNNEREVRDEYKSEIDRLHDEIEDLRAEIREKECLYDNDCDKWDGEKRNLESQRDVAEEKATGLQSTIDRLQKAEGTLSNRETRLQEALQAEKDRNANQEALLNRQIEELNEDVETRRKSLEEARSELSKLREELRLSQREQKSLVEKIEGLEDEVEILQSSLDEEGAHANQDAAAAKHESENLRSQLQALKQDLSRAELEVANAKAEVNSQPSPDTREGSRQQLRSTLREAENQLIRVRRDKQALQDELADKNVELHSLRLSKAGAEAERDEAQSELRSIKQQEEVTFRLDEERVDLRAAKMKLDGEVRRLREENRLAISQQEILERELQQEIDRANAEEARLTSEIHDLQKILRGSSEKRELSIAKKTIHSLEERIRELEQQLDQQDGQDDVNQELSILRHDLSAARQKETEYLQREASQKDVLRGLKRQITELERKAHDVEISRLATSSPHSSINGSARKSELIEVRAQLAAAHQTVKDIRSQLKQVEKESNRKLSAANIDLQARVTTWEAEKDELEHALDEARFMIDDLTAKNATTEATITRLRGKIDRLEKVLQAERVNSGESRTMVLERRDLHDMLRETQVQAETLEVIVQERDNTIAAVTAAETEIRNQLNRVRKERSAYRSKASTYQRQLIDLQQILEQARADWEEEKKALTKGVRFVNTSLSTNHDDAEAAALRKQVDEREHQHIKELRGMQMQLDWLKARCRREETFRACAAYAKNYMGMQIDMYQACNKADLRLLESIPGIKRKPKNEKKKTFRGVAQAVRAIARMKIQATQWKESVKIQDRLIAQAKKQRKMSLKGTS